VVDLDNINKDANKKQLANLKVVLGNKDNNNVVFKSNDKALNINNIIGKLEDDEELCNLIKKKEVFLVDGDNKVHKKDKEREVSADKSWKNIEKEIKLNLENKKILSFGYINQKNNKKLEKIIATVYEIEEIPKSTINAIITKSSKNDKDTQI
jgi:hypothetical protein